MIHKILNQSRIPMQTQKLTLHVDKTPIKAILNVPEDAETIVIFSNESGGSRLSPRNNKVAKEFQKAGFATLLYALISEEENSTNSNRTDIDLIKRRLITIILWLKSHRKYEKLKPVLFSLNTGTASALKAASELDGVIKAIISQGGRPDLALKYLGNVTAPTLLIVGELDTHVMDHNRMAYYELHCPKQLVVVPGASHHFEEPGKLEKVGELALKWIEKYVTTASKNHMAESDIA